MVSASPILLAEDDENDLFFMQSAMKKVGLPNRLIVVRNGQEAIKYLTDAQATAGPETPARPGLVLLDINMPIQTGFDVLQWLQTQPFRKELVVVMLTSSSNPGDIAKALALGAEDYLVKPCNAAQLVSTVRQLQARWLTGLNRSLNSARTAGGSPTPAPIPHRPRP